jgi:hypothetical protein
MAGQQVAKILAGAEKLQHCLQPPGHAIEERFQLGSTAWLSQEPIQVIQSHIRVRTARQKTKKRLN